MENAIAQFASQFTYEPEIVGGGNVPKATSFVVAGMGGSHLAADIIGSIRPDIPFIVHRSYGLPPASVSQGATPLYVASSYSGNTEETLDFAHAAHTKGLPLVIITVGGALLSFAQEKGIPHIILPSVGIQPRMALGYTALALAKIIGDESLLAELRALAGTLSVAASRAEGEKLSHMLAGKVPIIYASLQNECVAYNWKIKCNETGKIPAFYNLFPELNHNELAGFDVVSATRDLSERFAFIFLTDSADDSRIQHRFEITKNLLIERGFSVIEQALTGAGRAERIFSSLLTADWMAFSLAGQYGVEPEKVAIIEQLKKLLNS